MKVYTLMQGIIFCGVFDSLDNAQLNMGLVTHINHWPKLHSFRALGKKYHVYETELNEKVKMD